MSRLIIAIVAAVLINGIIATLIDHVFHTTGVYPPYGQAYFDTDLYTLALSYRFVITIFAAYVTAAIARERAKRALWISGIGHSSVVGWDNHNARDGTSLVWDRRRCDGTSSCAARRKTLRNACKESP